MSSRRWASRAAAAALAGICVAGLNVGVASATFPGRTGQIVFEASVSNAPVGDGDDGCTTPSCHEETVRSFDPFTGRQLALNPCTDRVECDDSNPVVSPDGRQIAFERPTYPAGADRNVALPNHSYLAVTDIHGHRVRMLTDQAFNPAWSPDGEYLLFGRGTTIYRVKSDGSDARPLVTNAGGDLDWSVRNKIVFTLQRGRRRNLYTVRSDGTGRRRLTRDGYSEEASFSPDGRWIAFTKRRQGRFESGDRDFGVYVMRSSGGRARRVTPSGAVPAWSPTGRSIAFVRGRRVFSARPDGSRLRRLFTLRGDAGIAKLSWRPIHAR